MLSLFTTRLIVSANMSATDSCLTFAQRSEYGIESVNTISSRAEFWTLSLAGPLITQCDAQARTLFAPAFFMMSAAFVIVPAVSTISSIMTTFLSLTSPIICMLSTTFARALVLLHNTNGQPRYLGMAFQDNQACDK